MKKQSRFMTSLVFLLATATLWTGCSHKSWPFSRGSGNDAGYTYDANQSQPVSGEPTANPYIMDPAAGHNFHGNPNQDPSGAYRDSPGNPYLHSSPDPYRNSGGNPNWNSGNPNWDSSGEFYRGSPENPFNNQAAISQGGSYRDQSAPYTGAPYSDPCTSVCEEPRRPISRCHYPHANELCCRDGIIVSARNPSMCMLGDQYPLEFDIKACDDVCDVVVVTHLPDGVSYVRSTPEGSIEGRRVVWNIGSMRKGECRPAKLWVRCECEGELCACFCATAVPVRFCSLLCAKPILTCEKCGPDEVCPGDAVHYTITVTNRGSCSAEDVVVMDQVPDGLEHSSCLRTLTYKLGTLEPCQTKKINICFTAVKRGKICNTAVVTACNADSVSCQWCTNVCKECIDIVKTGPREQMIGKNADYQITVTNPGDKSLTDVIITDIAPNATTIVSADEATVNGNQSVWRLKELKPGEKASFGLTLTTCTPGCFTNRVNVNNCQGCVATAEFTTRWKGRPALNVQVCDTEDPICIGETTSYCITVVNQGSEADTNVVVTVNFPKEITPISSTGDTSGSVSGQTVTFAPALNLPPRSTLKYRVDARGVSSGDARVTVHVTSDSIKNPIVQQESTIVN